MPFFLIFAFLGVGWLLSARAREAHRLLALDAERREALTEAWMDDPDTDLDDLDGLTVEEELELLDRLEDDGLDWRSY